MYVHIIYYILALILEHAVTCVKCFKNFKCYALSVVSKQQQQQQIAAEAKASDKGDSGTTSQSASEEKSSAAVTSGSTGTGLTNNGGRSVLDSVNNPADKDDKVRGRTSPNYTVYFCFFLQSLSMLEVSAT